MTAYRTAFVELSEEDFAEYKKSTITELTRKIFKLNKLYKHYWPAISTADFNFEKRKKLALQIENLTKSDILEFIDTYLLHPTTRRMIIMEFGKQEGNQYTFAGVDDKVFTLDEFRALTEFQPKQTKKYEELS